MDRLNFTLFKQGAEGRVFKGTYLNKPTIAKERFPKKYRHPDLDLQLTRERIKSECRAIMRCKSVGLRTTTIYLVDFKRRTIFMEYFENNMVVKDFIPTAPEDAADKLAFDIGTVLGKMHASHIVHGDLTTSNMLLVNDQNEPNFSNVDNLELIFIDFGLAQTDASVEDKGVDLYVLERALISTHSTAIRLFDKILEGYQEANPKDAKDVFRKFEEVRLRGRKRTMVG